jgi:prephenate dehydrogenase
MKIFPQEDATQNLSELTIGVAGLGLMGGSLSLGLAGACAHRIGMEINPQAEAAALSRRVVDEIVTTLPELVDRADMIVLAAPVRGILTMLRELALTSLPAGKTRILIDLGSTKQEIVGAMAELGTGWDPIGAHPICGREVSGVANADGRLFQHAVFVNCPLARSSPRALEITQALTRALGADPLTMDAIQHDQLVAVTSHLPYLAALALSLTAGRMPSAALTAGSGFRDTSRLAGSSLEMMMDILTTNQTPVLDSLDAYMEQLVQLRSLLQASDESRLRALLEQGRQDRERLLTKAMPEDQKAHK